jgi:hypothetical protein
LQTAAASSGVETPAIGAWMMGTEMSNKSVSLVFTGDFPYFLTAVGCQPWNLLSSVLIWEQMNYFGDDNDD